MRKPRDKRSWQVEEEEPEVDDLQVAAAYAQIPVLLPIVKSQADLHLPPSTHETSPDDAAGTTGSSCESDATNSEPDEEKTSSGSDSDEKDIESNEEEGGDEGDSGDDDDESEVDLSEALARMQENASDDEEGGANTSSRESKVPPKTEHEVDPYRVSISELETKFQISLTVEEQDRLRIMNATARKDSTASCPVTDPENLCQAGYVKSHMVSDRTLVVESSSPGSPPLDEGSLLVIRVKDDVADGSAWHLIPLGKVLEVFGPVSRPLYTIRLPDPGRATGSETPAHEKKKPETEDTLGDEIPLSDTDSANDTETPNKVPPSADELDSALASADAPADPWNDNGAYTQLIKRVDKLPVYYITDITRVLDTGSLIRNTGRGCDASNKYDEEVDNTDEMYFSDDEKEREFKNRHRGRKGSKKTGDRRREGQQQGVGPRSAGNQGQRRYTGFYDRQQLQPPAATGQPQSQAMRSPYYAHQPPPYQAQQMHPYYYAQPAAPAAYGFSAPSQYPAAYPQQPPPVLYPQQGYPSYPQPYGQPPAPANNVSGGGSQSYLQQPDDQTSGDTVYYDYS